MARGPKEMGDQGRIPAWIASFVRILSLSSVQRAGIILGSIMVASLLLGQNLWAKWWIIDDHEIMWFLGAAGRLSITEIGPKLMQTEIGPGSSLERFRPAYYILRLLETWAWGRQPALWYAFRELIFAFFLSSLWEAARVRVGFIAAGILVLYTASFAFWSDIFARLGPSEAYAVLGLGLVILGVAVVDRAPESTWGWVLLLFGTVVAAGSKENFVLLALLCIGELLYWGLKGKAATPSWLCVAAALLWCGWIAGVVLLRTQHTGADVYGNSVSLVARLGEVLRGAEQPGIVPIYGFLVAFLVGWYWARLKNESLVRACRSVAIAAFLIIGVYLSQVAFYNGNWPTGDRYDFPGMLGWPAMLFLAMWFGQHLGRSLPATSVWQKPVKGAVLLAGLVAVAANASGFAIIRIVSATNVRRTAHFAEVIDQLSRLADDHPAYPVLFQSDNPWDYEPLWSYPRFLTAYGVRNDKYLLWTSTARQSSTFLESLNTKLAEYSSAGLPGEYLPLSQFNGSSDACILVVLTGTPARPCQFQVDGQWRVH